jgi:hypothetical protein
MVMSIGGDLSHALQWPLWSCTQPCVRCMEPAPSGGRCGCARNAGRLAAPSSMNVRHTQGRSKEKQQRITSPMVTPPSFA